MPTSRAYLATNAASRYLIQFCRHCQAINRHRTAPGLCNHTDTDTLQHDRVEATCTDTQGLAKLPPWGQCHFTVTSSGLLIAVSARDERGLRIIERVVAANFARFGCGTLNIAWHTPDGSEGVQP
ncbi:MULTISPECIES: DUF2218 domain-containing protein [Mycobacteriaceae]|uniref:DUF2218 domain-containing protein n=1 Tax=Mycobacteriaceae TaxID=1762 RepID=UPI001CD92844|nr:DUF2218 domain-containing protein [Mycobacterium sp. WUMAC-067]MCA2243386.1 DUF2218 domain-containing protein [Mycobacterium sp. WUMAC-067]